MATETLNVDNTFFPPFSACFRYGMTETSAMCAILPPEFLRSGAVGVPVPCAEIKLVDVEDMSYKANADPPQGEVSLTSSLPCRVAGLSYAFKC